MDPIVYAPDDDLKKGMKALATRDLQLWLIALLVLVVIVAGVIALVLPNLSWTGENLRVEATYLPQVLFGLMGIIILFNIYVLQQRRELNHAREQLLQQVLLKEKAETVSLIDPLTELFNRRYLDQIVPREVNRAKRNRSGLTFALVDISGFKGINKELGSAVGDQCLIEVAHLIEGTLRGSDTVIRYGGDQFLVLMPETALEQARYAIERLQGAVTKRNAAGGHLYEIKLHCGLGSYREGADIADVLRIAEQSLRDEKLRTREANAAQDADESLRCLLACSNAEVLGTIKPALAQLGIALELCTRAEDSLAAVARQRFDCVIIDTGDACEHLPILRHFRQTPAGKRALLGAIVDQERREEAYRHGANLVFTKPLAAEAVAKNMRVAHGLMVGERQRFFRYPANFAVALCSQGNEVRGTATNLSEGGMVIRTDTPVEVGHNTVARFRLDGVAEAIETQAEIAWTDIDGRAGLRFSKLSSSARHNLERWLRERFGEDPRPQQTEKRVRRGAAA